MAKKRKTSPKKGSKSMIYSEKAIVFLTGISGILWLENSICNTAQSWWCRCAVRFFVRLYRNDAAGLAPSKEFLCKMTEKMQADAPPSRQAGFVRCCLYYYSITGMKASAPTFSASALASAKVISLSVTYEMPSS